MNPRAPGRRPGTPRRARASTGRPTARRTVGRVQGGATRLDLAGSVAAPLRPAAWAARQVVQSLAGGQVDDLQDGVHRPPHRGARPAAAPADGRRRLHFGLLPRARRPPSRLRRPGSAWRRVARHPGGRRCVAGAASASSLAPAASPLVPVDHAVARGSSARCGSRRRRPAPASPGTAGGARPAEPQVRACRRTAIATRRARLGVRVSAFRCSADDQVVARPGGRHVEQAQPLQAVHLLVSACQRCRTPGSPADP